MLADQQRPNAFDSVTEAEMKRLVAAEEAFVMLVPVGSVEPHGPHSPAGRIRQVDYQLPFCIRGPRIQHLEEDSLGQPLFSTRVARTRPAALLRQIGLEDPQKLVGGLPRAEPIAIFVYLAAKHKARKPRMSWRPWP